MDMHLTVSILLDQQVEGLVFDHSTTPIGESSGPDGFLIGRNHLFPLIFLEGGRDTFFGWTGKYGG